MSNISQIVNFFDMTIFVYKKTNGKVHAPVNTGKIGTFGYLV